MKLTDLASEETSVFSGLEEEPVLSGAHLLDVCYVTLDLDGDPVLRHYDSGDDEPVFRFLVTFRYGRHNLFRVYLYYDGERCCVPASSVCGDVLSLACRGLLTRLNVYDKRTLDDLCARNT